MALDSYTYAPTTNTVLGGGICYIAEWDGTSEPEAGDFVDMGNVTEFSINPEVTKLEHSSFRSGRKTTDVKVVTEEKLTFNLKLDTINENNLKIFFSATINGTLIRPLTNTTQYYALKFVPDYESGVEYSHYYWKVEMSPSEAINVINMEGWQTMGFSGEILEDTTNHGTEPHGQIYPKAST